MSRLANYVDNPMFLGNLASFKGIKNELDASPIEELDLLIRWLGPEPSKQAANIRACNAANSADAVNKIWNRQEQRYLDHLK